MGWQALSVPPTSSSTTAAGWRASCAVGALLSVVLPPLLAISGGHEARSGAPAAAILPTVPPTFAALPFTVPPTFAALPFTVPPPLLAKSGAPEA
ncbi:hypothetical protein GUJ93_ZPchr0010g8703 [Zizania palustris]|uniref:Uncharacterized protein n=1 Tax=Zizania palustris TaxID=103762 RepID=A0A8J6BFW6_ZIZPA|nr:hypothetical protein GUJ93_ZPchr0010g8703 [Zizania palustris]